jgi:hypothetical protein
VRFTIAAVLSAVSACGVASVIGAGCGNLTAPVPYGPLPPSTADASGSGGGGTVPQQCPSPHPSPDACSPCPSYPSDSGCSPYCQCLFGGDGTGAGYSCELYCPPAPCPWSLPQIGDFCPTEGQTCGYCYCEGNVWSCTHFWDAGDMDAKVDAATDAQSDVATDTVSD